MMISNLVGLNRRVVLIRSFLTFLLVSALVTTGYAQDRAADFMDSPILVIDTGGHHGRVRALLFTPDEKQLLSGGDDKTVRVWDLSVSPPRLASIIRPPIWRGWSGAVYAMAFVPADQQGPQLLAVAGHGVLNRRGEVRLFQYPGTPEYRTGHAKAVLGGGEVRGGRETYGHEQPVNTLDFDPQGKLVASGGNDLTIRLWNARTRDQVAVLRDQGQLQVRRLAFTSDGRRLVSGGADGVARVWDLTAQPPRVEARVAPPQQQPPGDPAINALAVSPDGRWLIVGHENPRWLFRYQLTAPDLAASRMVLPTGDQQGAVEAIAFAPDGKSFATSIIHQSLSLANAGARPSEGCDVELRNMPEGAVLERVRQTDNRVLSLAFSPSGRYLAFGGSDRQAVFVKDLRAPAGAQLAELAGQGWSIWDVGFVTPDPGVAEGPVLAYSYSPAAQQPEVYWGFSLRGRSFGAYDRKQVHRALTEYDGWTVHPVDSYHLEVRKAGRPAFTINLDPAVDRRWWAYSFIPPGPKHPKPTLAIATDVYAVIYRLEDSVRTRVLDGHSGSVYCLAPSADEDRQWLATGSSDQTMRLWSLAGCDVIAPLGAMFERRGGDVVVSKVEPNSFADVGGLRVGDVPTVFGLAASEVSPEEFLERHAGAPPNQRIELKLSRPGAAEPVLFGTSKRDRPALSLFVGLDQEWVVWMPRGYYETSIAGDRRFLGWHRNAAKADGKSIDLARPTVFFTIDQYEKELRKPAVLDRLLETADVAAALGLVAEAQRDAPALVAASPPPIVAVNAKGLEPGRPLVVQAPVLSFTVTAETDSKAAKPGGVRRLRVLVDGRLVFEPPLAAPRPKVDQQVTLTLAPGRRRVSVIAVDDRGRDRAESFDVDYQPPLQQPPPVVAYGPREPRLIVQTFGSGEAPGSAFPGNPANPPIAFPGNPAIPPIAFAAEDANEFGRLMARPGVQRFKGVEVRSLGLYGTQPALASQLGAALDWLESARDKGELASGDTVVLFLESHVVREKGRDYLVPTDAGPGYPPAKAIPTSQFVDCLGNLADYCRVAVFIDGVHAQGANPPPPGWNSRADDLVRALYKRNVIVFTASIQGPSRRLLARGHGAFAEGILTATPPPAGAAWTLDDFGATVSEGVLNLTNRGQIARLYVPGTYPSDRVSIFEPAASASGRSAR